MMIFVKRTELHLISQLIRELSLFYLSIMLTYKISRFTDEMFVIIGLKDERERG